VHFATTAYIHCSIRRAVLHVYEYSIVLCTLYVADIIFSEYDTVVCDMVCKKGPIAFLVGNYSSFMWYHSEIWSHYTPKIALWLGVMLPLKHYDQSEQIIYSFVK